MPSRSNSILHIGNFGDYHLLQDLGQGACGKVKLAMNNETGETVRVENLNKGHLIYYSEACYQNHQTS